jgi:hypothetical protein
LLYFQNSPSTYHTPLDSELRKNVFDVRLRLGRKEIQRPGLGSAPSGIERSSMGCARREAMNGANPPKHMAHRADQLRLELGVPGATLFGLIAARLWLGLAAAPWPRLFAATMGAGLMTAFVAANSTYGYGKSGGSERSGSRFSSSWSWRGAYTAASHGCPPNRSSQRERKRAAL